MLRLRPQPFATGRNRPCQGRMAVLMTSSAKAVTSGGFKRHVASFRVAGVALCDIRFQKMSENFSQHFGNLHRHFPWQAQHFRRVVLRVLRIALSGLRQVVTTCKFRGRLAICEM